MKARVTEEGVLVPKEMLEGMDEVEIHRENGMVVIVPVRAYDPIFDISKNPMNNSITDASVNHDRYLYSHADFGTSQDDADPLLDVVGTLSGEMLGAEEIERELYGK